MNPLTQIKNTQKISREEIAAGYSDSQSWHARFKHSAYIYTGGLPYTLTDGDLLAIFAQYGDIIDVNLVRHQDTGKPRGFAFLAYEDQRSTVLAVDNLNGTKVGGRIITVDHVDNYKRKRAEMEGREASESEGEEQVGAEGVAEADAMRAALGDGAQVVSEADAMVGVRGQAAGGRGGDDSGDAPWASKTSVYALLNSEVPVKMPAPRTAVEEEEDPMHIMKKQKKLKKEKKSKKKKDKKEKKEACRTPDAGGASSDTSTPPRGNLTKEPLPSLPGSRQAGGDRRREGEGSRGGYLDGRRGREDSQERKWRGLGPGRGLRERNDPRERDREEGYRGHPGREDRRREDRRSREDKSNGERREDSRTHRR